MEKNDRDYSNGEITVHWRPSACVHSTICYTKLRKVFDPPRRPWVNMKGASTNEIIEVVKQCPTDALTFSWDNEKKDFKEQQNNSIKESATNIQIMKNGPAIISGDFSIKGSNGNKITHADTVALCRCGHSSNMPFCDGTHNSIDFTEKGTISE